MDILRAVNKVGEAAGQAVAAAHLQRQIEVERRSLADLRTQAYALRAEIGEEMYKLWQARNLPPSSLDHLFVAIERAMATIADQRMVVDRLLAQRGPAAGSPLDGQDDDGVIDVALPPPPLPAAPTRRIATVFPPVADACPTCGATGVLGKPYCGYCGSRLG